MRVATEILLSAFEEQKTQRSATRAVYKEDLSARVKGLNRIKRA